MAKTAMYRMHHRRRREQKTDYRVRLPLVRSGKVRAVIRKSGSHMLVQFIRWEKDGDKTLLTVTSKHLKRFGWDEGTGNVPSAYLTGLLAARLAKTIGLTEVIIDMGMQVSTKGSRLYATIKGLIDGGLDVPCDRDMLPDEGRIKGVHIEKWEERSDIQKRFAEVRAKIESGGSSTGSGQKHSKGGSD